MNLYKACNVLDLSPTSLNLKSIKKAYFKKALQWHPDKNISIDASYKFQEIKNAYDFLLSHDEQNEDNNQDYFTMVSNFLKTTTGVNIIYDKILSIILGNNMDSTQIIRLLKLIDYDTSLQLLEFLTEHANFFGIDDKLLSRINIIINIKSNNNCIILEPTIDNLFNNDIYNLDLGDGVTYCIPLWHNELEFDFYKDKLIVKIEPILPDNIIIDDDNNIHIYKSIDNYMKEDYIVISISNRTFDVKINAYDKNQTVRFSGRGISKINIDNILSIDNISDVIVHIAIT